MAIFQIILILAASMILNASDIDSKINQAEYAIYARLLETKNDIYSGYSGEHPILIAKNTVDFKQYPTSLDYKYIETMINPSDEDSDWLPCRVHVDPAALDDFFLKTKTESALEQSIPTDVPYVYVYKDCYTKTQDGEESWDREGLLEKYPDYFQIVMLSRVGFNKELNQAIVYLLKRGIQPYVGPWSYIFKLEKKKRKWEVTVVCNVMQS